MKEIEKARACPICGGKSEVVHGMQDSFVRCLTESCLTLGPRRSSDDDALEAWNKRIALETDKPTEDIKAFTERLWREGNSAQYGDVMEKASNLIQTFFKTYHEQKCEECASEKWSDASLSTPCDGEYIVKVKNERGEIFVTASMCEDGNFDDISAECEVLAWQDLPGVTTDVDKKEGE